MKSRLFTALHLGHAAPTWFDKTRERLEKLNPVAVYVGLAAFMGIVLVFANPLFAPPDEVNHFRRAYQVADFRVLPQVTSAGVGGYLPTSVADIYGHTNVAGPLFLSNWPDRQHPDPLKATAFPNTGIYSPVVYLPQALGINIGRVLHAQPVGLAYLGRIVNLLAGIALIGLAIYLAPVGKWALAALGLLPMTMQQAASLSADVVTNGLAFVFIALIIRLFAPSAGRSARLWWGVAAVAVLLALAKQPFGLLAVLLVLVPQTRGWSWQRHWTVVLGIILGSVLMGGLWSHISQQYFQSVRTDVHVSIADQTRYITAHPLRYLSDIRLTFSTYGDDYVVGFIGNFDSLDIPFSLWTVILGYLVIAWTVVTSDSTALPSLNAWRRLAVLALALGLFLGIVTLLYLSWNAPGSRIVEGFQSRYLIALAPLTILLVANKEVQLRHASATTGLVVIVGSLALFAEMLARLHRHFS